MERKSRENKLCCWGSRRTSPQNALSIHKSSTQTAFWVVFLLQVLVSHIIVYPGGVRCHWPGIYSFLLMMHRHKIYVHLLPSCWFVFGNISFIKSKSSWDGSSGVISPGYGSRSTWVLGAGGTCPYVQNLNLGAPGVSSSAQQEQSPSTSAPPCQDPPSKPACSSLQGSGPQNRENGKQ